MSTITITIDGKALDEARALAAAKAATGALKEIAENGYVDPAVRVEAAEAILRHYRHFC